MKIDEEEQSGIERRMVEGEIRAVAGTDETAIEGTAAVYNKWSEDLGGFREMIEPGFFENVLKNDVRALWNHNDDLVLGRTRAGTLALTDTERGLDYHITPPDTQVGRDAVTSIKRGDVTQSSFAFIVKAGGDEWIREKDGSIKRVLKRGGAAALMDVSPVTFPAYRQTSVHARSMVEKLEKTGEGRAPQPDEDEQAHLQARAKNANRKRKIDLLLKN